MPTLIGASTLLPGGSVEGGVQVPVANADKADAPIRKPATNVARIRYLKIIVVNLIGWKSLKVN